MLGKRKTTMRRTSSVSHIGSGSGIGDGGSPLPEHPKEKLKSSNYPSPAPRQVIGFHPKGFIDVEQRSSSPVSPHRASSPRSSSSSKSPSGSPRSGLGDLLGGSRPWERKEEGVGLSIVAALSGSQEEVCSEDRDDGLRFSVPGGCNAGHGTSNVSPQARVPSVFAHSRGSPPVSIRRPPHGSNSGRHSPSRCVDRNCCPSVELGLAPPSFRQEPIFHETNYIHQAGGNRGSRANSSASNGGPWPRPNPHNGGAVTVNWNHHDMDVDRTELHAIVPPSAHLVRQNVSSSAGFTPSFPDACHLCSRRLGEGRDIFMYRGDKFCSPECRQQQIVNDERPEKCATAVMKVGGVVDVRSSTQRTRVMAAGTATAAAA